tara:strand:- start:34 stop:402 length:369 start_codon:yes stop_codon:yes gene_type:complete
MLVVIYLLSSVVAITLASFCFVVVLWMMNTSLSFEEMKEDFMKCLLYNVIMDVVILGILGLSTISPALGGLSVIAGIILSVRILMSWFDLGFFEVVGVSFVAGIIQSFVIQLVATFLVGLLM